MFNEFNLAVPAGDEPTGDSSGTYYPVWISRIVRNDVSADSLTFYFATYAVVDDTPSTAPIEFAMMTLLRTYQSGRIVSIDPIANLLNEEGTDSANFNQHFGRGHVVLSDQWSGTTDNVTEFFDAFIPLIGEPAQVVFTKDDSILSSYSLSRVPKYIPTIGESQALKGSAARRIDAPSHPSDANRYVTENDQGEGDKVDFSTITGITSNPDIERYAWKGSLVSKKVKLIVNAAGTQHNYPDDVLPRLRCLLGRDPIFGDEWWEGTRWLRFNGDTWTG